MWGGWQDLTSMLWAEDKWGGERASALERTRVSERAYVQEGGRVGEREWQRERKRERTSGWVLWNPLTGELCAFVRHLGCLPNSAHCNRGMIVDSRQPSPPPRLPRAWTQPSSHRWHGKTRECLLSLLPRSLLIPHSSARSRPPLSGSPLPLLLCRRFSCGCVQRFGCVSGSCGSSRWQERWVGRKPWQLSLCRAPSSPPPGCPGMGAVRWQTHNVSVCFVVVRVCVHISVAATQSQNWPGQAQRGTVPPTLVCGGQRSLQSPPLALLWFGVGSVSLHCAYSWWYVLTVCCVWIPWQLEAVR